MHVGGAHLAMSSLVISDEGKKVAIEHLKKASAIYSLAGNKDKAKFMDSQISIVTAMQEQAKMDIYMQMASSK